MRIGILTGTRADFGLLCQTILKLQANPRFDVRVFACGTHLSPEYGATLSELYDTGIKNIRPIEMLVSSSTQVGVAKSVGLATLGFAEVFSSEKLDCLLVLGDRFEAFAAAQTALFLDIPIAHIHGGEVTEGAFDDALRHAISKMASIHFPAAEQFARRLEQLGEQPNSIFVVGSPGLDNIMSLPRASGNELADVLSFKSANPLALVTYHPVTRGSEQEKNLTPLLQVIKARNDLNYVVTYPNADGEGARIIEQWQALAQYDHVKLIPSLGFKRYLSVMDKAACVVGNSSSGIIEAPAFGIPTVNIGSRQQGRPRSKSVIDVAMEYESIIKAIDKALSPTFATLCRQAENPYGKGGASDEIVKVLGEVNLEEYRIKQFFDVGAQR